MYKAIKPVFPIKVNLFSTMLRRVTIITKLEATD